MSELWSPTNSQFEAGVGGLTVNDVTDDTKLISARRHDVFDYGTPIIEPIVHSSMYRFQKVTEFEDVVTKGGYMYVRYNSPTCEAAEVTINLLEGGAGSVVLGSGMAAISTALLGNLKAGDHVVTSQDIFVEAKQFMVQVLSKYNIETTFVPSQKAEDYLKACKPNTKMIYAETLTKPTLTVTDMEKFGALGASLRSRGVISVVDASFANPYLVKPISYGVDLVINSGTKYLGGHADLCAGVVTCLTKEHWANLVVMRRTFGTILSPHDGSLLLRGLKTLHLRVPRQSQSALRIAEYQSHPDIERVFYPGLKSHPEHEVAKKQMKMFGGMVVFIIKGDIEPARRFVEELRLINLGGSLVGSESMIEQPATMSHGPAFHTPEERRAAGFPDGCCRLGVGLEDADDLIADIKQALDKATK